MNTPSFRRVANLIELAIRHCEEANPSQRTAAARLLALRQVKLRAARALARRAQAALKLLRQAGTSCHLREIRCAIAEAKARMTRANAMLKKAGEARDRAKIKNTAAHAELSTLRAMKKALPCSLRSAITTQKAGLLNRMAKNLCKLAPSRCASLQVKARVSAKLTGAEVPKKQDLQAVFTDLCAATDRLLASATRYEREMRPIEEQAQRNTEAARVLQEQEREAEWEWERRQQPAQEANPCTCYEFGRCDHCWYEQNYPQREAQWND